MDNLIKVDEALSSTRPAVTYRRLLQSSLSFLRSLKDPSVRRSLRGTEPLGNLVPSSFVFIIMAFLGTVLLLPVLFLGLVGFAYVLARPELWLWAIIGVPAGFITLLVVLTTCSWVADRFISRPVRPVHAVPPTPSNAFEPNARKPGSYLP